MCTLRLAARLPPHITRPTGRLYFSITASSPRSLPPFPSPFLPGSQTHTAAELPNRAAVSAGKCPFIWPAVKVLQREEQHIHTCSHPTWYPPFFSLFPCSRCLSHRSPLIRLWCSPPLPLSLFFSPIHPNRPSSLCPPFLFFYFYQCSTRMKLQSSAFFSRGTWGKKEKKKETEMSWAGGFLHHITGLLPIKEETLCYWRAAEPIRRQCRQR